MPRLPRQKSGTKVYHIIIRGINRQIIFEEQEDVDKFLYLLKKYKKICGYELYAYCLMGNHIHLLIKEGEDLGIVMRRIGASVVSWYNLKYERTGHLFQGRYKSEVVEDRPYLLNVIRYIHQNPLKAGIVNEIATYHWSSYSEYFHQCRLIDRDFILGIFHEDREVALAMFKKFHQKQNDEVYLDVNEYKRLADCDAQHIIRDVCQVERCTDVQKLKDRQVRDRYLRALKEKGLSSRQISRLTGISRRVILKAK